MSTDNKASIYKKPALEIKSTSFSTSVLAIFSTDLKQIQFLLEEKIALAPEFFKNSSIVIDIQGCPKKKEIIDLSALIKLLYAKKLVPIGINGGNKEQNNLALAFKIPVHTIRGTQPAKNKNEPLQLVSNKDLSIKDISLPENESSTILKRDTKLPLIENMFISQPIRSGQRVYAKGDLTILSHVSAGAEVMAEGSIHVYGALRGRALAGVQGNTDSRIFCSSLEAELVSIAGNYIISEVLDKKKYKSSVQIFLQKKALIIEKL
ncbi:MAG: septum site-determining protein MinC [Methylococcales bacterium]|nr:septum site-determining protein MinC [Methylococcales bacterium]